MKYTEFVIGRKQVKVKENRSIGLRYSRHIMAIMEYPPFFEKTQS